LVIHIVRTKTVRVDSRHQKMPERRAKQPKEESMKIDESSTLDADGCIRADLKDIGKIIDRIDKSEGRNDALKAYVYALRDLQRANDRFAGPGGDLAEVDQAQAKVAREFDRLIAAEFMLNREEAKLPRLD
jgi:hypothetical protein